MLHHGPVFVSGARFAAVALALSSLGCFAYSHGDVDWDDKPVVTTGAGATIIYPGQTAPTYYPSQPAGTTPPAPAPNTVAGPAPVNAPAPAPSTLTAPVPANAPAPGAVATGERQGNGAQPGGMPITMIGGAEQESEGHLSWKQELVWWKYLALPFALVAAPFKAIADARGEPEPGPAIPPTPPVRLGTLAPQAAAAASPPAPVDYESTMVDRLEQELDQRQGAPESTGQVAAATQPDRSGAATGAPFSIADELAALQQKPVAPSEPQSAPRTAGPPALAPVSAAGPAPSADGVVDRDGDGRVDQWIYRDGADIARIDLDENGDGRPDRTIHYDRETHQIRQVEEDENGDGAYDAWTDYADGHVTRRRSDANFDGTVDAWSFYSAGVITRHERDTNGDGFRDRVGFYADGKLDHEDQDSDGDGVADVKIHYDAGEHVIRREEDNDHDGLPDVVSYYEAGRLARREILTHEAPGTARP